MTKLDKMEFGHAAEAETIRKMIGHGPRPPGADHQARRPAPQHAHPAFQPAHKQQRTAWATLEVLALANRLGLQVIRRDLEDLAFATLCTRPSTTRSFKSSTRDPGRREHVAMLVRQVAADLRAAKTKALVTPHPRHYYSIYQTMLERAAARSTTPTGSWSWSPAGPATATSPWGGARALAPGAGPLQGLHRRAQAQRLPVAAHHRDRPRRGAGRGPHPHRGHAPHGRVRGGRPGREAAWGRRANGQGDATGGADDLVWLHRLLDWQRAVSDPREFLESLRSDLSDHEVLVFTPKGDALTLPAGATPVDMAYALRTELGHHCIGARVNGQLVPLASVLADGDVVEILTSTAEYPGPSKEWLGFVKSPRPTSRSASGWPPSAATTPSRPASRPSTRSWPTRAGRSSGPWRTAPWPCSTTPTWRPCTAPSARTSSRPSRSPSGWSPSSATSRRAAPSASR